MTIEILNEDKAQTRRIIILLMLKIKGPAALGVDVASNYLAAATLIAAPLLVMPIYLKTLGAELFGLISFIALLQSILGVLDGGISQVLVPELAKIDDKQRESKKDKARLVKCFEKIYWSFGLIVFIAVCASADYIVEGWIDLGSVSLETGRHALYASALMFAFQLSGALYRSVLVGLRRQPQLNFVIVFFAVLRHGGGAFWVSFYPEIMTYLAWYVSMAGFEFMIRGLIAWYCIDVRRGEVYSNVKEIKPIFFSMAKMTVAVWVGSLCTQVDKIIVSRMVTLESFGYYMLATMVASGALQAVYPIVQAVLPRASRARQNARELRKLYFWTATRILWLISCGLIVYILMGAQAISLWLRDENVMHAVYPVLSVLLVGTALNAIYNIGYMDWVVFGRPDRIITVNLISLVASLILIPPMVKLHGLVGGSIGWLTVSGIGAIYSLGWLRKKNV